MIRDIVLTLTLLSLVFLYAHQPTAVKTVQTDYCVVTKRVAGKDEHGVWHFGWGKMYAPCSDQPDIYRFI